MTRLICRALSVVALSVLVLAAPLSGQVSRPPANPPARPKLEAVAETRLLMEGLAMSNYRGLERLLKEPPTNVETWTFARGQALLIAETGNLLLLRPPKNPQGEKAWMELATDLREQAATLARRLGTRDYPRSVTGLKSLTNACNRCHQTFRVPTRVGPAVGGTEHGVRREGD
jgi:hypothetical protein